jgi:hypothetical protein
MRRNLCEVKCYVVTRDQRIPDRGADLLVS